MLTYFYLTKSFQFSTVIVTTNTQLYNVSTRCQSCTCTILYKRKRPVILSPQIILLLKSFLAGSLESMGYSSITWIVSTHLLRRDALFRCHLMSADESIPLSFMISLFVPHAVNHENESKMTWAEGYASASFRNRISICWASK
jgi:hypothetical protein